MPTTQVLELLFDDLVRLVSPPWHADREWYALSSQLQPALRPFDADADEVLRNLNPLVTGSPHPWFDLIKHAVDRALASEAPADAIRRLGAVVPIEILTFFGVDLEDIFTGGNMSDAHVHAGGAVPYLSTLDQLLSRAISDLVAPDPAARELSLRSGGRAVDVRPLLAGVGVASLHDPPDDACSPAFWAEVLVLAAEADDRQDDVIALFEKSRPVPAEFPSTRAMLGRMGTGRAAILRDTALAMICAIHMRIATAENSSLCLFVADFNRFGVLRDLAGSETFQAGALALGARADRLELRKTFSGAIETAGESVGTAANLGTVMTSIHSSLQSFIDGVDAARHALGRPVVVQMPVGLLKARTHVNHTSLTGERFRLSHQLVIAEGFVQKYLAQDERVRTLFASFDVAGLETSQPNWIYTAAFNHVEQRLTQTLGSDAARAITYSGHAGEYFENPLAGLRSIHEFVQHAPKLHRIGHALVLDEERSLRQISLMRYETADTLTAVEDLAWARSMGELTPDGEALLEMFGAALLGQPTSAAELQRWYHLRFDLEFLRDYCGYDEMLTRQWPIGASRRRDLPAARDSICVGIHVRRGSWSAPLQVRSRFDHPRRGDP